MADALNKLATYIRLMNGAEHPVLSLTEQQLSVEQQADTEETHGLYTFSNGVVLCYTHEQDRHVEQDSQQCTACWLSYEVQEAAGHTIWPERKVFHSTCQLTFWLRMQQGR